MPEEDASRELSPLEQRMLEIHIMRALAPERVARPNDLDRQRLKRLSRRILG
jgi:hypothetical protein